MHFSRIIIPDSVSSINSNAFTTCTSLKEVILPKGLEIIGGYAFYGCTSLSEIVIPDNVTTISGNAFGECSNLKCINIPDSVVDIGEAFIAGTNIKDIDISETHPLYIQENGVIYNREKTSIIYVCDNVVEVVIPKTVTDMPEFECFECK